MNYTFERENNRWYIVLPSWTGEKAELEMVCGADTFLDILAQGENTVNLNLSLDPIYQYKLTKVKDTPEIGGAVYLLKHYIIEYNLEMWLCQVTEFVFGYMPEVIYFQ